MHFLTIINKLKDQSNQKTAFKLCVRICLVVWCSNPVEVNKVQMFTLAVKYSEDRIAQLLDIESQWVSKSF